MARRWFRLGAGFALGGALAVPTVRPDAPTRRLTLGNAVAGSLEPGEEHRFRLELPEDHYAVLAVEGGEDLPDATLEGPEASSLAQGRERVFFLRGGGAHTLSIR